MTRRVVATDRAPEAIGPYAQAIAAGETLYCSGQIALDPATGELVAPDDVSAQTHRVMQNLQAVLEAGGSGFDRLLKTTIYLVDMGDFATVNAVYAGYLGDAPPPARATVAVAALPKGARVEIDAVAGIGN
jgi:2-iminobutanoate/2-iminopropanoate deaminase